MIWACISLVIIGIGAFLFYASYSIRSGIYVKALCKKETKEKLISLTFDDGPDAHYTPQVLDVLKQFGVQATFFCIGNKAEKYPAIIRRIQEEGHLIGNHSYSHSGWFPLFSLKKMTADLQHSQQILEDITGSKITHFRPPFGVTNPTIAKAIRQSGYTTIGWNIRSFDTKGEPPTTVYNRIIKQVSPGSIILLHDRLPNSKELLTMLLTYLTDNNYKAVRVDGLFESVSFVY